jgi:hypothetical protein
MCLFIIRQYNSTTIRFRWLGIKEVKVGCAFIDSLAKDAPAIVADEMVLQVQSHHRPLLLARAVSKIAISASIVNREYGLRPVARLPPAKALAITCLSISH